MRKAKTAAAAAVLPLVLSVAATGATEPAAARAGGTVTSASVIVLFDSCDYHPVRYNLAVPAGAEGWSADLVMVARDGTEEEVSFVYGDDSYDDAGRDRMFLCSTKPGRYRLKAEVEYYDSDYNDHRYNVTGTSFTVRYPRSRSALAGTAGRRLNFVATIKDERPRGFFPTDEYTDVVLQQRKGGRWVRVGTSYTNAQGRARFSRPNNRGRETFRVWANFASYDDIQDSVSKPITR